VSHSYFLAFLLDPRQTHGLGDAFARRFLRQVLATAGPGISGLDPADLDAWDLGRLTVRREWWYIDVLLVDEANRLVVVIENKIDAAEGPGQLAAYLAEARRQYPAPDWRHLAIYLTPDERDPSVPDYLAVGYGLVAEAVAAVAVAGRPALDPAVGTLMVHYVQMLRRHIVTDPEFESLFRQFLDRHPRVVERILADRPNRLAQLRGAFAGLVRSREADGLILDAAPRGGVVHFGHGDWEWLPRDANRAWTPSGRLLLFSFEIVPDRLQLTLWVGPGPEGARQRVIEVAAANQPPYVVEARDRRGYRSIFYRSLVTPEEYANLALEDVTTLLGERFAAFADDELPGLVAPFREVSSSIGPPLGGGEDAGVAASEFPIEAGRDR
jgi:hypothetical protein